MGATNSEVVGGIDTYVLYGVQTSYTTGVTPGTIFGGLVTSSNFETDRQYNERTGFVGTQAYDGRATAQQLAGTVTTNGTVEFDVQRWDWLEYVLLANRTGSGTTGTPYEYTIGKTTKALTVSEEIDNVETDSHRVYEGMVINSVNIRCSVGEPVTATVNLMGGRVNKGTTIQAKQSQLTDEVYNFSGGSITFGAGVLNNIVDSIDITITNNYTLLYGFNEEARNARAGKLNLTFRLTTKYLDDTQMAQLLGSSTALDDQTPIDVKLKFEKGTNKYIEFDFKDVVLNRSGTRHQLNEFVVEETDMLPKRLIVKEVV